MNNRLEQRIRLLTDSKHGSGPIVYWMSRDQRIEHNWAFCFAQKLAVEQKQPLIVVFNFVPVFLGATWRQYSFMIAGLQQVEIELNKLSIPFYILLGEPDKTIAQFVKDYKVGTLVTDFSPLNIYKRWKVEIADILHIPFYEVDAHNIVPCWLASPKQEFSARTFRLKMNKIVPDYLDEFPSATVSKFVLPHNVPAINWDKVIASLQISTQVKATDFCLSGSNAAWQMARDFIAQRLCTYDKQRNDPNQKGQSDLSPYLHFGQISAQQIALEVMKNGSINEEAKAVFLEELIIRRELSDNFCFYNDSYDQFNGFPAWARKTLEEHSGDKREFIYTLVEFELAQTHDPLWNAAQIEMINTGKMHGYMRMYWAKKILEWSASAGDALKVAIYLNDKYELDGRDPNGYAGIAWSIGGVHDRPWFEKPVFGKIRYMNSNGCARKFDVAKYIKNNSSIIGQ